MVDSKFESRNSADRKAREQQQKTEYHATNHYLEAYCMGCGKKDLALARVVQICNECLPGTMLEAILKKIKTDYYGFCFFCAHYKSPVHHVNVRLCKSCAIRISRNLKNRAKQGGLLGTDPFFTTLWKKHRHELDPVMEGYFQMLRRRL